ARIFEQLIKSFGSEYTVLLNTNKEELAKVVDEKLVHLLIKNREGTLSIEPGYDGVYGKLAIQEETQKSLSRFLR
ncbi:MAG: hypothetical protein HY832_03230, partial [Candidatus Aenigmarchaeota archaeon]|nr:hypothetical protein [Candidatus Aenigmarchaeota archaeon]